MSRLRKVNVHRDERRAITFSPARSYSGLCPPALWGTSPRPGFRGPRVPLRGMNLFRSEEHCRNMGSLNPEVEDQIQPLSYWMERFSQDRHRARIRPDYTSWMAAHPR